MLRDVHVMGLLDMLAATGRPNIWELPFAEGRRMALQLMRLVEAKEPISNIESRTLPGPTGPLPYRMYTPVVGLC